MIFILQFFCILQFNISRMSKAVKSKIYQMLETIEDELVLTQVMEEVAFYASTKDIVDNLNKEQMNELDKSIEEANNNNVITLGDFKKEINEWRKK